MEFTVVDVETANQARSSICQIGIARFRGGQLVDSWQSLVDPEGPFSFFNIRVHGIRPADVAGAPKWKEIAYRVNELLEGTVIASHTFFDRGALEGAHGLVGLPALRYRHWIDTCVVARATWPMIENHKLPTLARHFGIEYKSHDALEDARVAGEVLARALEARGLSVADLVAEEAARREPSTRPSARTQRSWRSRQRC